MTTNINEFTFLALTTAFSKTSSGNVSDETEENSLNQRNVEEEQNNFISNRNSSNF